MPSGKVANHKHLRSFARRRVIVAYEKGCIGGRISMADVTIDVGPDGP